MSNILIVESKNDKCFVEALIKYLNCQIEVSPPIYIEDYKPLAGLDQTKFQQAIKDLEADLQKKIINKVGIMIDIDNFSKKDRLNFINHGLAEVFKAGALKNTAEFIELEIASQKVQIACYFTNVNQKGELETLLKEIKNQDSSYADCLQSWKTCIEGEEKTITDKELTKFWLDMYIRFDTCSKQDKKQADRKCSMKNFDYVMENKQHIWNFDHPTLNEIKTFLKLFCN